MKYPILCLILFTIHCNMTFTRMSSCISCKPCHDIRLSTRRYPQSCHKEYERRICKPRCARNTKPCPPSPRRLCEIALTEKQRLNSQKIQPHPYATKLHWMIKNGADEQEVYDALKINTPFDMRDEQGRTPLHWAAIYARPDIVRILTGKGAAVNARDFQGNTPLQLGVSYQEWPMQRAQVIEELVVHGANIYSKNNSSYSALDDVASAAFRKLMFDLIENRADNTF